MRGNTSGAKTCSVASALVTSMVPEAEPTGSFQRAKRPGVREVAFLGHPLETYLSHLLFQLALLWLGTNVHYPGGSGTLSRRLPEYAHFHGSPRTFLLFPSSQTRSQGHLRPFPVLFRNQTITQMLWHLLSISHTLPMRTEG